MLGNLDENAKTAVCSSQSNDSPGGPATGADMASTSDSETMMEVEAPNNSSEGGAASGPPPRLMISKMVRVFCSDVDSMIRSVEGCYR